jgi:hypothetical protein
MRRFLALIPGIALLAILGYAGKVAEQSIARYGKAHHLFLPNIESRKSFAPVWIPMNSG